MDVQLGDKLKFSTSAAVMMVYKDSNKFLIPNAFGYFQYRFSDSDIKARFINFC